MQYLRVKKIILSICSVLGGFCLCLSSAHAVFINEIHYDNMGSDVGEGVELTGAAGQDLSGWSLLFYNGYNGSVYRNYALSGVFTDMQAGRGVLGFSVNGIQNGGSDGIALVNGEGSVLQFLSYEGRLTATSGAAMGMTSTDIGAAESNSTPVDNSLQLFGNGSEYTDFSWGMAAQSLGGMNARQAFTAQGWKSVNAVPEPGAGILLMFGLMMFAIRYVATGQKDIIFPA